MTTNTFTWLHLTDFHFGLDNQHTLWANLLQPFLNDLATLHAKTGPWQVVFFTGDLVQQGKSEEFHAMQKEVLDKLWEKLTALGSGDAVLLAVAGNHDLFRPNPRDDNPAMDALLNKDGFDLIADKFWNNPAGTYCRASNETFAAYTEWWQATPHRPKDITKGILAGDFAHTLQCCDKNIGIIGLNTAFLQLQGGDYKGKLAWDARQLNAVCSNDINAWLNRHDLCLLLTHQGQDWLTPEAKKHGETEIAPAGRFALHLFGHQHEADYQYLRVGGSPKAIRRLQACSVFGMENFGEPPVTVRSHGYAVGRIEFNETHASLKIYPRIATDKPQSIGWRFIPDNNLVLDGISTAPETLFLRGQKTVPSIPVHNDPKPTASPAVPHSTLPARRPFFGRVTELANIARYLQPDHTGWGVVLDGVGGIGKTSLAIEAAHLAPAERFPLKLFITAKKSRMDADGERTMHDGRADDYFNLLTEMGRALGCEKAQSVPPEQQVDEVRHALIAQKVLLVLDNLEAFSGAERRRIYDLLETLPATCRAIVTSRRRDETSARTIRLDKLDFVAAQQLLAELSERNPFMPTLTEDDQQLLYAQTGGNPLLLTWTAGQLGRLQGRCRTVDEAIERLIEAHEKNNDPLEFVFGDLLDTFTNDETKVLAALVFFTEPAPLAWLLPLAKISEMAALTALDDLRNRALLQEDATQERWLLPPLAARFLRLRRPDAVQFAGQQLENEAYSLAVQYADGNYPYTELEAHWVTVEAALPLLIAGDNQRLQTVCDALDQFLHFTGRWNEQLSLSLQAEAKALAAEDYNKASQRAYDTGWVHFLQGTADAVLACADRCAAHWNKVGADIRQQAAAIHLRGLGYRLQKDYPAAIRACSQALALWRSLNPESVDVVSGLSILADFKKEEGDFDGAEMDYREALRIARKLANLELIAGITGNLAALALDREDWQIAEGLAREAVTLSEDIGRLQMIASSHHNLAFALLKQGNSDAALPHAQQAVTIRTQLDSPDLVEAQTTLAECVAAMENQ